jgi:serpin B
MTVSDEAVAAARADGDFGADLHRRLAAGNLVFSPASIATALAMALCGARGGTAAQMTAVLHLPGPASAPASVRAMGEIAPGAGVTYRAPNTIWVQDGLAVRPEFLAQPVTVEKADFRGHPAESRTRINDAVAEATAGQISSLLPPGVIDRSTALLLVNAVYLLAPWATPFPARATWTDNFYPERSVASPVQMMRLQTRLAYRRAGGYQSVLLPYRGGALAMAIVLPDGPLGELAVSAGLFSSVADLALVDLRLPRFRVRSGFKLSDPLRSLGMTLAFSGDADFSGISAEQALKIRDVVHQAYVDVAEEGTEAAAATAVTMVPLAVRVPPKPDVVLTVDRPFLFAIIDTATGLPLFQGQVTRP